MAILISEQMEYTELHKVKLPLMHYYIILDILVTKIIYNKDRE